MKRTILSEWIKLRTILSNKILVAGAFLFPFVVVTLGGHVRRHRQRSTVGDGDGRVRDGHERRDVDAARRRDRDRADVGVHAQHDPSDLRSDALAAARDPLQGIVSTAVALIAAAVTVCAAWLSGSTIFNSPRWRHAPQRPQDHDRAAVRDHPVGAGVVVRIRDGTADPQLADDGVAAALCGRC